MIDFDQALASTISRHAFHPAIRDVLDYAVRPPGKLFRPRFLEALALDLGSGAQGDIEILGCALELHHAYSLVHDDMPCMDNDLVRRGKPTTHVAFGEWKALLAGDALMLMSYAELERLKHQHAPQIRRLFHWATGPKGLILGQWIDLGHEGAQDAHKLMRMHDLKTARLMQVAALGALALSRKELRLSEVKHYLRFGSATGLAFQLLDDLDDLSSTELSPHEKAVNPFLLAPVEAAKRLRTNLLVIDHEAAHQTRLFLGKFLRTSAHGLVTRQNIWGQHVTQQRDELIKLFTSGICV